MGYEDEDCHIESENGDGNDNDDLLEANVTDIAYQYVMTMGAS